MRALLGALVVVLVLVGLKTWPIIKDRRDHPSVPVLGTYDSSHLGAQIRFTGPDWRRLEAADLRTPMEMSAGETVESFFFRGSTASRATSGLTVAFLRVTDGPLRSDVRSVLFGSPQVVVESLDESLRMSLKGSRLALPECDKSIVPTYSSMRCSGTLRITSESLPAHLYLWKTRGGLGMVLVFGEGDSDAVRNTAERILETIDPTLDENRPL